MIGLNKRKCRLGILELHLVLIGNVLVSDICPT